MEAGSSLVPAVDDDLLTELGHIVVLFSGALLKAMAVGTGKYFGSEKKLLLKDSLLSRSGHGGGVCSC